MDTLSKNEVMYVKDEYDKMGFPSEIKQQGDGYICEISKKWYSYEGILPQVNDSFYIMGEDENLPYKIISFEIEDDVCNLTVQLEGADDDDLLEAELDTFNVLKTTPWTAKDKRDYFVKYELPKVILSVLSVILAIVLVVGLIALLGYAIFSQIVPETLAKLSGEELSEIQPLWRMMKSCLMLVLFISILHAAFKIVSK
ncbi:MAG: hypothetical protein IJN05_02475 [Ruminococcus sp.]|nr:hypothetical protein [Ruminococcus sp.]